MGKLSIPCIVSYDPDSLRPSYQPIIQIKDLEVDRQRYDAWLAGCKKKLKSRSNKQSQ